MNNPQKRMRAVLPKRLLFLLFVLICMSCCAAQAEEPVLSLGTFSETNAVNASLSPGVPFGAPWYYAESTLPEGMVGGSIREELTLWLPDGNTEEKAAAVSLSFLSGDAHLRDALEIVADDEGFLYLISRDASPLPGEAVFRICAESENLYAEEDFTLRILSWAEDPLYVFKKPDRSAQVFLGSGDVAADGTIESWRPFTHLYTGAQLSSLLVTDHAMEIAARVLPEADFRAFSAALEDRFSLSGFFPEEQVRSVSVIGPDGGRDGIQFLAYGSYASVLEDSVFGLSCDVALRALSYEISGPSVLAPGDSGTWRIQDARPEDGRTFAWYVEGADAVFQGNSAAVTLPAGTPEGASFTLSAIPDSGEPEASLTCTVSHGILSGILFRDVSLAEGFTVPVPADGAGFTFTTPDAYSAASEWKGSGAPYSLYLDYRVFNALGEFAEDAEVAGRLYDQNRFNLAAGAIADIQEETIEIQGHPAAIMTARMLSEGGDYSLGALFYVRNNRVLRIRIAARPTDGEALETIPAAAFTDLRNLAGKILYDPSRASVTVADGALSLTVPGNVQALSAGKKLRFSAAFANPEQVNQKANNNAVEWTVTDAQTGEPVPEVTVDRNGTVAVSRQLAGVKQVTVTVSSPVFHTAASCPLTALPALKKLSAEPQALVFYAGETRSETVRAVLTPESVPPAGLTWQVRPEGVAEIVPGEEGTAVIRPGKAGKAKITVKEPGGKTAGLAVSVLIPVESVELSVRGKARPGGTVACSAALLPRNAGNRSLEWSLDVGEETASVNSRGQIRINRAAPAGTVLTVTCQALGAPEPVTASIRITVGD